MKVKKIVMNEKNCGSKKILDDVKGIKTIRTVNKKTQYAILYFL